ncbi:leucine-rich repeat protein [Lacinutrix cladophorae]
MKKILLVLTALFISIIGHSQTFTALDNNSNTLEFDITTATTVDVIDYVSGGTDIDIPSTIDNPNDGITYSVTGIGNFALQNNNLTSVTIPDSVTFIGENAFVANLQLTCVISEATIPPVIFTGGGTDSFGASYRSNINLSIPSGTASAYAAATWAGFNSVAEGLNATFTVDYITYQINGNNEVTVTGYNTAGVTSVNIPDIVARGCISYNVTNIGNNAFNGSGLTNVVIPDGIINIGTAAFAFNNLQSLVIPDSVLVIGDGAFAQNNNLNNVVIGNSVTSIGDAAFRQANFTSITIPDSVLNIGLLAFMDVGLTDVTSLATTPPTIITGTNDTFGSIIARGDINLHIPPNTTGAYVTDAGALWTDFLVVTEDAGLSVSDFELMNDIKIITRANDLKVISPDSVRLENYTIYNISGAKVKTGKELIISTNTLSNGIYILKLDFNEGIITKKVIIN